MILSATIITAILSIAITNGESTEEQPQYTFNNIYTPTTVNFNDIYSSNIATIPDEPIMTTLIKDDDFHLNMPAQLVEFHALSEVTTTLSPKLKALMEASFLKEQNLKEQSMKKNETEMIKSSTSTSTKEPTPIVSTTEEPDDFTVKVLPIKQNYQRGVLDLLFPAARVRTFKNVFDTFRRILSYTFRKR